MSPQLLAVLVLLAGAAAAVWHALREGRRLDDLDPRAGDIVYEDVQKPDLEDIQSEGEELESVPYLYYVDNAFAVAPGGRPQEVSLIVQGKADRVVRKRDGSVHVIDYKSGSSGHPDAQTETKLPDKADYYRYQLMAYFLMLEQSIGERPAKAIIDFLDGPPHDFIEIENTEEIRQECLGLLREIVQIKLGAIPAELLDKLGPPAS